MPTQAARQLSRIYKAQSSSPPCDIREAGRQHLSISAWCLSEIGVEVADDDLRLAICDKPRKDLARLRCLCWRVGFIEMRRDKFDRHAIEIRIDQHITALRRQRTERCLKHVLVRKRVRFRPSNRKTRHPGARQHD